jgi:homoserine O-succinyltransferase/O-acetyltransferase
VLRYLNGEMASRRPRSTIFRNPRHAADRFDAGGGAPCAKTALSRDFSRPKSGPNSTTPGATRQAIINNWLGLVYQLTNLDRRKQFMDGVDPHDPLGLRTGQHGFARPETEE